MTTPAGHVKASRIEEAFTAGEVTNESGIFDGREIEQVEKQR